jgi:hypothetical protein
MKVNIPPLKTIPGIPTTFGDELRSMTTAELEKLAEGCTPSQVAAIDSMTEPQLLALVNGTPDGLALIEQLERL